MKKLYIPIILFSSLCMNSIAEVSSYKEPVGITGTAQAKSRSELKGDKHFFVYSYKKAIESYTNARSLSPEGQRRLAESYRKTGQHPEAEMIYSKLIGSSGGVIAEDYYNYAMILRNNAKYSEANKSMDKFREMMPNDLRAQDYAAHGAELPELLKDKGDYKLLHLDVNSGAQDFGPCYYKNSIVFASTRSKAKMFKRTFNGNGKPFLNMYVSEVKDGQLEKPVVFDKSVNTKMHDGPASFNKEGTYMAFTKNNSKDRTKDKIVELRIYFRSYTEGEWSKPEPFVLNNEGYSVGQPCLSADGKTMYFTSDKPGGFGKADIYKVSRDEKGTWGQAENLGDKINTEGDEMFPYLEENSGTFFFSSDGRFGLGGLDIFTASVAGSGFNKVHNAGSPLNTQYDDFAAIADGKTNKGYFSSNRTGGSGDDDIYAVDFLKGLEQRKHIEGIAKDKNGTALPKTFVTFMDDKGNTIDTVTTGEDAAYSFFADTDKNFKLTGKKERYKNGESPVSTFGKELAVTADVTLLTADELVAQKIETDTDLGKIVELNAIYFDLDKSNIRPDAVAELDKIVKVMNKYPDMIVHLSAFTDCRESNQYNIELSDKRAKTSAWYIKSRITNPGRVSGTGYGETKLVNGCSCDGNVVSDCTEAEHQKNRRTEFTIVKPATAKK
jgi:outer membrane protein OmpA-like peptidoglycan-associated protein